MANDRAPCDLLAWDTAFWGFPIARVRGDRLDAAHGEAIDAWAAAHGVRCQYFLARADDPATTEQAEARGYRLVDVRVTLDRPIAARSGDPPPALEGAVVRPAAPADVPALERLASTLHHDTRFYYDRRFPRAGCDRLYATWIRRSCEGYADRVLVADVGGAPAGYISCHHDVADALGRIGLVGVAARASGRGLGQALVRAALDWFGDQGLSTVHVVTQGRNLAAQRLYQRHGFRTCGVELWYHRWYDSDLTPG